jgi:hypothetical protein
MYFALASSGLFVNVSNQSAMHIVEQHFSKETKYKLEIQCLYVTIHFFLILIKEKS